MKPVGKQYFVLPEGMWGVADVSMHFEAMISQHPDATRREELMVEYKALERDVALRLLASYHEFEHEVETALQRGANRGAGNDG